ncbi:hypothetical protein MMC07_008917 [Pseudocyphellaria aurata]|nr:hypothetical protein [Pseudocyphellaria aurata]
MFSVANRIGPGALQNLVRSVSYIGNASNGPEAINDFVRTHERELASIRLYRTNWLIIDQRGIDTDSCLVVDQIVEPDPGLDKDLPISLNRYLYNSRATRAPFIYTVDMLNSLTNGKSKFSDWVWFSNGVQLDGCYLWTGQLEITEACAKRDLGSLAALSAMADCGHYMPPIQTSRISPLPNQQRKAL